MIRKGKEHYLPHYKSAIRLYNEGMGIKEIADRLKISYSCVYHWVRGLRKPLPGNINEFVNFLDENGPSPVIEIRKKFPKHNEIFHICSRRDSGVRRVFLGRKFLEYSTWYYMKGQEKLLESRIGDVFSKIEEFKKSLREALDRFTIAFW